MRLAMQAHDARADQAMHGLHGQETSVHLDLHSAV